jgi:hypothetical protein
MCRDWLVCCSLCSASDHGPWPATILCRLWELFARVTKTGSVRIVESVHASILGSVANSYTDGSRCKVKSEGFTIVSHVPYACCVCWETKRRRNVPGRSGSVRETWHPAQLTGRVIESCTPQTDYKVRVGPGSNVGLCMLDVAPQKRPFWLYTR